MPGKLIWLVGPSGSGKDSLLAALRQREHPQLLVAHRYITRPFNAGSENHIALSEHEFLPAPSSIFLLSAGTPTILTMALAWRSTSGCTPALTWWPTAPAPIWRWPGNATARCWCRSVSPSRRRCCASGWSSAAGKTRWKSPSVWNAPRAISRTLPEHEYDAVSDNRSMNFSACCAATRRAKRINWYKQKVTR